MPTRNVVLTDEQSGFVEQLVSSGQYQNASEVLRDGLRMLERRERDYAARIESLRDAVAVGVADVEAGDYRAFTDSSELDHWIASLDKPD